MTVETVEDRSGFFQTGEFAEACSYTPAAGGDPISVKAIFDRSDRNVELGVAGLNVPAISARLETSAIPSSERKGGVLEVDETGERFVVRKLTRDATRRVTVLELDEA